MPTSISEWSDATAKLAEKGKWRQIVTRCRKFTALGGDKVPLCVLVFLARAQRHQQALDACAQTLAQGARRHPDAPELLAEQARLEMARMDWPRARQAWRALEQGGHAWQRDWYLAHAKVCERQGDWSAQQALLLGALERFPGDPLLYGRLIYASAVSDIDSGRFELAAQKFAFLTGQQPAPAFGVRYFERLIAFRQGCDAQSLAALQDFVRRSAVVKAYAEDTVGLPELLARTPVQPALRPRLDQLAALIATLNDSARHTNGELSGYTDAAFLATLERITALLSGLELAAAALPMEAWFILSNLASLDHRVGLAYALRNKGAAALRGKIESALSKRAPIGQIDFWDGIRLCAESLDKVLLSAIGEHVKAQNPALYKASRHLLGAADLYFGKVAAYEKNAEADAPNNAEFAALVRGKRIAIVGPCEGGAAHGLGIDQFDLVIRFNYRGIDHYDASRFGTRTDIAYYVDATLKKFLKEAAVPLDDLAWLVYQSKANEKVVGARVRTRQRRMYPVWGEPRRILLKGNANAVQKCLSDIIRFAPAQIKIFNVNMFIEENYNLAYKKFTEQNTAWRCIWHDSASNFLFTKRLFEAGIIEADALLANILSWEVDRYMRELDRSCGRQPVSLSD